MFPFIHSFAPILFLEVVGSVGAIAGLVQQSFQLLDQVQAALDHNKEYAMHLTVVARDVEGTKSIVQQVENNTILQTDTIQKTMESILDIAKKLDELVTKQEEKTRKGTGFRNFAHSFAKGPKEQKQLEQMRDELMQHKNTLILCIVVSLAPSGARLDVRNVKMDGAAIMQNGRVMSTPETKDFDVITIKDVTMGGSTFMNNSSVTPEQQDRFLQLPQQRQKMELLLDLVKSTAVPDLIKQQIITQVITL
ncbi:hypothetical protein O1611_g5346 [Lasiodiplodia mahajangana]|uniref:Uncharacterized protein n=1 Tax=Lasiodiplodia mahajangana TaxID=1108764 RepID=A0ACC2JLA5_9PEZI|nr:hypothetical protein O1611_g5346 [Lasiodiplodia mahajangana]